MHVTSPNRDSPFASARRGLARPPRFSSPEPQRRGYGRGRAGARYPVRRQSQIRGHFFGLLAGSSPPPRHSRASRCSCGNVATQNLEGSIALRSKMRLLLLTVVGGAAHYRHA